MSKKLTIEEFVEKAKLIHGDKYDYSKVEYHDNKTKVTIICPEHGEFKQIPSGHFRGDGCPICRYIKVSNARKLTQEQFIEKAKSVHGDRYSYNNLIYKGSNKKVEIICKEHGVFWQIPGDHLQGAGCTLCSRDELSEKYKLTTEEFIEKANKVHNNKYDYSKVNYINSKTKVTIICPVHGEFEQKAGSHLQGSGCLKCGFIKTKETLKNSLEEFIILANKIHNNKYGYSKTNYEGNKIKIRITCPIHGEFWQTPNSHLNGSGCPKCKGEELYKLKVKSLEDFILDANKVHNNKYGYNKAVYINSKSMLEIICKEHGSFWQTPNSHLRGDGCPNCKEYKGEVRIKEYLEKNNINFETQKTFNNCKNKNLLRFDFYLPNYNLCIEHNGAQHYRAVKWFGGEKTFKTQQIRDKIKAQYCGENRIKLLIIPYWEFINIEKILEKEINS